MFIFELTTLNDIIRKMKLTYQALEAFKLIIKDLISSFPMRLPSNQVFLTFENSLFIYILFIGTTDTNLELQTYLERLFSALTKTFPKNIHKNNILHPRFQELFACINISMTLPKKLVANTSIKNTEILLLLVITNY